MLSNLQKIRAISNAKPLLWHRTNLFHDGAENCFFTLYEKGAEILGRKRTLLHMLGRVCFPSISCPGRYRYQIFLDNTLRLGYILTKEYQEQHVSSLLKVSEKFLTKFSF